MNTKCIAIFFLAASLVFAQDKKNTEKEKKEKTIAELTKGSKKMEGLFTLYQDSISGAIKMAIHKNQLNKDYIYFAQIADGIVEAGAFRGLYRGASIFNIKKYFNKIEIQAPNTNFYFDPQNALAKSQGANTSQAVLSSSKILTYDEEEESYLIDADNLFLSETLTRIKQPNRPNSSSTAFRLGSFDKGKSKIESIKNYPENTNIKTEYVFRNPSVLNSGSDAVTDGRNVSIQVFHAFVQMPDDAYEILYDDPRVGYFITEVDDMTSTETLNFKDLVNRWRLVKKDPNAPLSEPVTPITWWIENSTPKAWRATIKEGVLAWNAAFEKAGFKNALVVKEQPEDADWDAGDIRYNVLRWTSSPNPLFGGYGPRMANPRTGEILGADIMLEFVHFTNRVFYEKLFIDATEAMALPAQEANPQLPQHTWTCSMGHLMHENLMFGKTVLEIADASDFEMEKIKREGMKALIMHEVGHTLGLNHNMKASHLFSPEQLADAAFIQGKALTASVMDYAGINLTLDRSKQGQYYDMAVGPYDIWAIQFGYTPFKSDAEREKLLERSSEPALNFGNDADDMRSSNGGIDPRVMIGDLSNDPIRYSIDRFKLINSMMRQIKTKFTTDETYTYDDLRRAYLNLNRLALSAGEVLSRFVGGIYVERTQIGQKGAKQPYTPVPVAEQKRAFKALENYIFSPAAFQAPKDLYNYLARQRRGFNFSSKTEDPKIHDFVLGYQSRVLAHLLHPNTLQRIIDTSLYGNQYSLAEFMNDLQRAILEKDSKTNVNSFRQNLQLTYVKRLIEIVSGKASSQFKPMVKSMALQNLNAILKDLKSPKGDVSSVAHKKHLKILIQNALNKVN